MNILFVCALPVELNALKWQIKDLEKKWDNFLFLTSWVWSYNTIYELQRYLDSHSVDFIVNIGVCWVDPDLKRTPSLLQVYRIKNLSSLKESVTPLYISIGSLSSIWCSEKIITNKQDLLGESFVDMESYGIDFIATKLKIPYVILKIPFDRVSEESRKVDTRILTWSFESIDYETLLSELRDFWWNKLKTQQISIEKYLAHYRFTFSEKEILKKMSKKYQVLHGDFDVFFEKNKELPKKEFLFRLQSL